MNIINKIVLICALLGIVSTTVAFKMVEDEPAHPTVRWNVVDAKGKRLCFAKELVFGVDGQPNLVWYDQTANEGKPAVACWLDDTALALEKAGQRVVYRDIIHRGEYLRNNRKI